MNVRNPYRKMLEVPESLQWEVNGLFLKVTKLGLQSYKCFVSKNNL